MMQIYHQKKLTTLTRMDLQQNRNLVELIESKLRGDHRAKERWLEEWGVDNTTDQGKIIEEFKNFHFSVKENLALLDLKMGASDSEIVGKLSWAVLELLRLQKEKTPAIIYKHEGKDYEFLRFFRRLGVIILKGGVRRGK